MRRPGAFGLFLLAGFVVTLALATVVSPWADSDPDGLERVAMDEGFADQATDHALADGPAADYQLGVSSSEAWSTATAAAVGVVLTAAIGAGLVAVVRGRRAPGRHHDSLVS